MTQQYISAFWHLTTATALAVVLALLTPAVAHADITFEDLGTLGGADNYSYGVTNDGTVYGSSEDGGGLVKAYSWKNGVITDLSAQIGTAENYITSLSANKSVMIGAMKVGGNYHAFRHVGGVTTDLGTLGGTYSYSNAISANGNIVVGSALNAAGRERAFRWENGVMTDLGTLGGNTSWSRGISADGKIITGTAQNGAAQYRAFRWENGLMSDLGTFGGATSYTSTISANGKVIVGSADTAGGAYHAFRWENGLMSDLGTLAGGTNSEAYGVSANGKIIVGHSDFKAVFWDNGVIADLNVLAPDLTGWDYLESAWAVSANGKIITGGGYTDLGDYHSFILNLAAAAAVTPEQLAQDLAPALAPATLASATLSNQIGSSLQVARNSALYFPAFAQPASAPTAAQSPADIEPAAGGDDLWPRAPSEYRHAVYAVGSAGLGQGDNDFSSTTGSLNSGLLVRTSDALTFGAGIIGARSTLATPFGGNSRVDAKGITVLGAYAPPTGLSFYGSAAFAALDASTDRRYNIGPAINASHGSTDGTAFGVTARGGYAVALNDASSVMPYAEAELTHARFDAYSETGGAFPAAIGTQRGTTGVSRLGAEVSHTLSPDLMLRTRAAWGHRYGDPDDVSASAATLTVSLPGAAGDRNWAEAGLSAAWQVTDRALLTADIAGRSGETQAPAVNMSAGVIVPF